MRQLSANLQKYSVFCVLVLAVLSGCRTYGGYDSEEAIYDQIVESNTAFANELEKARGDLSKLQQAASQNAEYSNFVTEYEHLLERHEGMVEAHAELTETLDVKTGFLGRLTPAYRNLNRALGNIAAEQAAMRNSYYRFAAHLSGDAEGDIWKANIDRSRYQAVPPYYQVISHTIERKTISAALE